MWRDSYNGQTVVLTGLSRTELNGSEGITQSFDAKSGRVAIKVVGQAHCLLVKPENLRMPWEDEPPPAYETCALCQKPVDDPMNLSILACGHKLHADCWDQASCLEPEASGLASAGRAYRKKACK